MLLTKNKVRRLLAMVLMLTLLVSIPPLNFSVKAADIPDGKNDNGYVNTIKFYQRRQGSRFDENSRVICDFNTSTTDYDITMIAFDGNNAFMTLEASKTDGTLWQRILIDGEICEITSATEGRINASPYKSILSTWMNNYWPKDGQVHTLSVLVGEKYDSNEDGSITFIDEYSTYDIYNFHVTSVPGLKTLSITDSSGTTIASTPAFVAGQNFRTFSIEAKENSIWLNTTFSDSSILYIGEKSYTDGLTNEEVVLDGFSIEGNNTFVIPLRLVSEAGKENTYNIQVLKEEYTPVIIVQPTPTIICDKDDVIELSVEAQAPAGSNLSYQWYDNNGAIDGATNKIFQPDTSIAVSKYQYWCVVTNTVAGAAFTAQSERAEVTVNLTYLNPPRFIVQPGTKVWMVYAGYNEWGNEEYPTEYAENTSFDEMFLDVENLENADIGVVFYLNNQPSYENAEILEGTLKKYRTGKTSNIYGFKADRLFAEGTYYVGCIATFSVDDETIAPVNTASDFSELTFIQAPLDFEGSGTQSDPYKLQNAEDLVKLSTYSQSGKTFEYMYFKVTDNITLPERWTPIGADTVFLGDFDGGGKTISYAPGSSPLFEKVGATTIHDLTIYGEKINGCGLINGAYNGDDFLYLSNITLKAGSSTLKSGFAEGSARAASRIAFENCTVEPGVTIGYAKDQYGIGSFVNALVGTLTNCRSGADVYGVSRVGGLAGSNANSVGLCTFTDCTFTGTVTATGNNAGGIIGQGYEDATAPNTRLIRVIDCTMSGTVSGVKNVGGLIGSEGGLQQSYDEASKGIITGNTVTATVTGSENVGAIAGLYSHLDRYTVFENNTISNGLPAFGKVYHVDTSAVAYGWHDGVFYFNSSANYSAAQLEEIYTALWTGWEDSGRWKPTSLITGRERNDNPLNCDATVETIEVTTMPTKTEYVVGEAFDGTGMVVTLTDLNGATRELSADEYTVSFDSSRPGETVVTITFGTAVTTFTVNVSAPTGETINVKLSILGDTLHEGEEVVHTLAAGNLTPWLEETTFTVDSNATVWNLLLKAFAENGMTYTFRMSLDTEYIDSVTFNGVTLREKDNNPNSGWQYTINGQDSTNGVNQQYLVEGDVICFHWTDDYTQEDYGGQYEEDKQAAMAVEALIDALPAADELTLADEEAIVAARAAYDALNDNAKSYVDPDCYAILVAAEARLAELKAEQAAADQAAADAVTAKIAAIGEVTLDSETAITEARAAYEALTDAQKALVTNLDTLTAAEARLEELKAQQADQQAADAVTAKIAAIGEVTLDSEAAITEARAAYDALTDAQKALVTNLETLTAAETRLAELKAEQAAADQAAADAVSAKIAAIGEVTLDSETAITEARAAYDALTDAQKALVTNLDVLTAAETRLAELKQQQADQAAADAVIAQIAAIGEVTIEDEEAIAAARAAYEALTPEQKALVGNIDTLTAAETAIEALVEERDQQAADAVSAMIAALPAVDELTVSDEEAITAARAAYDALTDAQKAKVTNLDVLKAAEDKLAELKFGTLKTTVKAVNVKDGTIKLTWTTIPGAVKYKVLVSATKTGTYKPVATVTGKTYTYKKGTVGKAAYFKVVGVNKEGTESAESAVATRFRLPGQVKGLKATSKEKKVTLKWTKVTGAKKYFVYVSKNGKTGWKKVGTVTTNKFVYEKGAAGKKLYFKVQAVTANGKKGEFSKVIGIKVKE